MIVLYYAATQMHLPFQLVEFDVTINLLFIRKLLYALFLLQDTIRKKEIFKLMEMFEILVFWYLVLIRKPD